MTRSRIEVLRGDIVEMTAQLLDDVAAALDVEPRTVGHAGRGLGADLDGLWELVAARVAAGPPAGESARLVALLRRIREAEGALADARAREGTSVLADVEAALATLSDADSVEDLLARAPEATCRLGFDRALVSTVDGVWRLGAMHVVRDQRWAEEIVAVGREEPPLLDRSLVESDTVTGARAVLVHRVQENPRVNRPLAEVTRSSSYGIAPLLVDGDVVGLLHGDYYHQARILDERDRRLLGAFAAGVSQNLARVTLLDGMSAIRAQFDGITKWSGAASSPVKTAPPATEDFGLTRREAQIMRHVAAGESNGRIARRLVISEGTVKTHITHILRKLNAGNRAEAVALWLRRDA